MQKPEYSLQCPAGIFSDTELAPRCVPLHLPSNVGFGVTAEGTTGGTHFVWGLTARRCSLSWGKTRSPLDDRPTSSSCRTCIHVAHTTRIKDGACVAAVLSPRVIRQRSVNLASAAFWRAGKVLSGALVDIGDAKHTNTFGIAPPYSISLSKHSCGCILCQRKWFLLLFDHLTVMNPSITTLDTGNSPNRQPELFFFAQARGSLTFLLSVWCQPKKSKQQRRMRHFHPWRDKEVKKQSWRWCDNLIYTREVSHYQWVIMRLW